MIVLNFDFSALRRSDLIVGGGAIALFAAAAIAYGGYLTTQAEGTGPPVSNGDE